MEQVVYTFWSKKEHQLLQKGDFVFSSIVTSHHTYPEDVAVH